MTLWRVKADMIKLGVRNNDLGSVNRSNRYFKTSAAHQKLEKDLSSEDRLRVGVEPNTQSGSYWYLLFSTVGFCSYYVFLMHLLCALFYRSFCIYIIQPVFGVQIFDKDNLHSEVGRAPSSQQMRDVADVLNTEE